MRLPCPPADRLSAVVARAEPSSAHANTAWQSSEASTRRYSGVYVPGIIEEASQSRRSTSMQFNVMRASMVSLFSKSEEKKAATTIQRVWRAHYARKCIREMCKAAAQLQAARRGQLARAALMARRSYEVPAAIRIQAACRGHIDRNWASVVREEAAHQQWMAQLDEQEAKWAAEAAKLKANRSKVSTAGHLAPNCEPAMVRRWVRVR